VNNILKLIFGFFVAVCLVAVLFIFLTSFWFWVVFEIIAALLVPIGCGGEWWCDVQHLPQYILKTDTGKLQIY
jgi:hypothetical protein